MDDDQPYEKISAAYDKWIGTVGDLDFYVSEGRTAEGPIVELGVGTGRVAIPIALRGVPVIGVDSSQRMLTICKERALRFGVDHLLDLRLGDFRHPPISERVALVICPFRTFSHLESGAERGEALSAVHACLRPGGRFIFDVATPTPDDARELSGKWDERAPGVWERAEWDWENRRMDLFVRISSEVTTEEHLRFAWLSRDEWRDALLSRGFEVVACYGWFDRRPCASSPLSIWVARPIP